MPSRRLLAAVALLALSFAGTSSQLSAQQGAAPPPRLEATRAELEAVAAHPPKGMSSADLAMVQARLANGDFAVGDKITIQVQGEATLSNTFTVSGTRSLLLPSLPPLSLAGVLRSESDSVITEFIGRYVRDPQVTVQPLIRLGVLGGVARPGYYDVPAQTLLSDVVMTAGGLGGFGDMKRTTVNRGNVELLDPKAANTAIANGRTLDLLNLQSGDNVNIGVQNPNATLTKLQIVTAILAIPLMIVTISAIGN
jgi:hypothetical protein